MGLALGELRDALKDFFAIAIAGGTDPAAAENQAYVAFTPVSSETSPGAVALGPDVAAEENLPERAAVAW